MTDADIRRAPEFYFTMMKGPEDQKRIARQSVWEWVKNLRAVEKGEIIIIPDPETGEPVELIYGGAGWTQ